MVHRKERLDVEVIRARGLVGKPGNKQTPGTFTFNIYSFIWRFYTKWLTRVLLRDTLVPHSGFEPCLYLTTQSDCDTILSFFFSCSWTILWGLYVNPCNLPFAAPYVKVYLLDNGKCINKKKTRTARKTLDPLYQQQLQFEENPEGKVLQVTPSGLHLIFSLY